MTTSIPETPPPIPVAVVGAGLAGLMVGRCLRDAGVDFLILDKSRGVGGRCATRRFGTNWFDHGAQFFTVRDPRFAEYVAEWLDIGLVREWSRSFPCGMAPDKGDGHIRYCAVKGMNTIPKHLARGLPIALNTAVTHARQVDDMWVLETQCGAAIHAKTIVLTGPLPQSLTLISATIRDQLYETCPSLEAVHYEASYALLLELDGPAALPEPGACRVNGPDIAWIADNKVKGMLAGSSALTIHSTPEFARANLEASPERIAERLIAASREWLGGDVVQWQVHRWRYSKPLGFAGVPCVSLGTPENVILCGDYMEPPSRIEGAILSGLAAARKILAD